MPRRPRGDTTNAFFHVSAKGNRGVELFHDDTDRKAFMRRLQEYAYRYAVRVHAYCLLTNHVHLLIETHEVQLSRPVQGFLQSHAQRINRRFGFRGHLFDGRYWSNRCLQDEYLIHLVRYIHLNPVLAGVTDLPEDYAWSSHGAYLAAPHPWVATDAVLDMFSRDRKSAVRAYAQFVLEGVSGSRRGGKAMRTTGDASLEVVGVVGSSNTSEAKCDQA